MPGMNPKHVKILNGHGKNVKVERIIPMDVHPQVDRRAEAKRFERVRGLIHRFASSAALRHLATALLPAVRVVIYVPIGGVHTTTHGACSRPRWHGRAASIATLSSGWTHRTADLAPSDRPGLRLNCRPMNDQLCHRHAQSQEGRGAGRAARAVGLRGRHARRCAGRDRSRRGWRFIRRQCAAEGIAAGHAFGPLGARRRQRPGGRCARRCAGRLLGTLRRARTRRTKPTIARLLEKLGNTPLEKRTAHYVCHVTVADPTGTIRAESHDICRGRIRFEPAGANGFGYDPLFEVVEYHRTFGELGPHVKQALSHRSRALRAIVPKLLWLSSRSLNRTSG